MLFGSICSRIGSVRRSDASWSGEGETNMKVREVLTPLVMEALTRLCRSRELRVSGTKDEVLRRLAHSYRGNLSSLVCDLRRQDLLRIASWFSDEIEFPASLGALRVSELREACLAVFEERYVATEGAVGGAAEDGGNEERQSEEPARRSLRHRAACDGKRRRTGGGIMSTRTRSHGWRRMLTA